MPPSPIHQNLHLLLPTLSTLPPDVIALASSLLWQSKIRAANLKPDEEVARIYACCDIAVGRLQGKLGLERGKARPPVPPRIYNKLRGYLDGVLAAAPRTPGGRGGDDAAGASQGKGKTPESRPTSMRKKWAEARRAQTGGAGGGEDWEGKGLDAPGYAMPMIRHLCGGVGVERRKVAPHVFTGTSVVLKEFGRVQQGQEDTNARASGRKRKRSSASTPSRQTDSETIAEDDIPGVILVLFNAVVQRMYGAEKAADMEMPRIDVAEAFISQTSADAGVHEAANEAGYFALALARFSRNLREGVGKWVVMEWFTNVPSADETGDQGSQQGEDDAEMEDGDVEMPNATTPLRKQPAKTPLRRKEKHDQLDSGPGGDGFVNRAGLLPGLATMFQPSVDWLSEDRMRDYRRWEKEMRREIVVGGA